MIRKGERVIVRLTKERGVCISKKPHEGCMMWKIRLDNSSAEPLWYYATEIKAEPKEYEDEPS